MDKNFYKYKRKYFVHAVIKSAVCGVSAGLIAAGAVLLALKLSAIQLFWAYYVLIGAGSAFLAGGIAFLIFRPTEKKVAKRLDNEYTLHERVQTALEFSGQEGAMLEVQREDTGEKLAALPKHRTKFSRIWQFLAVGVLSLAVISTAVFIPAAEASAGPIDPDDEPYTPSTFEMLALEELIKNVQDSRLSETPKSETVSALQTLYDEIQTAETAGAMREFVFGAIDKVETALALPNSYNAISSALTDAGLPDLSRAVRLGANAFGEYDLSTYELTKAFYKASYEAVLAKTTSPLNDFRTVFTAPEEGLAVKLNAVSADIAGALVASTITQSDGLYVELFRFSTSLRNVASDAADPEAMPQKLQGDVDKAFQTALDGITDQLSLQSYNLAMNRFVSNSLRVIFGFPPEVSDTGSQGGEGPSGGTSDDDDNKVNGGGYGSGETIYGSDDEIFDPSTGKYVKYSELLSRYYATVQEYLRQGNITPEQEDVVRSYFEMLFSGADAGEE